MNLMETKKTGKKKDEIFNNGLTKNRKIQSKQVDFYNHMRVSGA